ncbi:A24 family peptidase [Sphaerisporangium sp. NPDC005289]|uniref:A24 family peptidase n=1 Tax=Sphaerisporangium sp. NPDC005289 TaxID=3155247 RepID=UPI00339F4A93
MSLIVAEAALAGLLAGAYVRVLAGAFTPAATRPDDESRLHDEFGPDDQAGPDDESRPDAQAGPDDRTGPHDQAGYQGPGRGAYWAEGREAFRRVVRAAPVPAWPPVVEAAVAAVVGLVVWRLEGDGLVAAWLYMALVGCALAVIDWRTQRLPDVLTLPSYPIVAALLVPTGRLGDALLGGLALAGAYAVLWFARPASLGLGDVKLAGLAGMLTGALGWDAWLAGAIAGQFLGALYAVGLLATRRGTLKSQFPLGPFILLGTLTALLVSPSP